MPRFPKPNVRRNARALQGALKAAPDAIVRRIRARHFPSLISPADLMTLANGVAGFMAIIVLTGAARLYEPPFFPGTEETFADDRFLLAGMLIAIGLVFDALDGTVAKKFGGSRLGGDLDTLCDAVTFVVTPALMVVTYYGPVSAFRSFLVAGLILVMGILRLARFNTNPVESETKTFQGLPTPWMAMTVTLMVVTQIPIAFGLPFAAVLAFLMMSNVAYPKSRGRTRYVTYLMVLSALVIIGLLVFFPNDQSRIVRTVFVIVALTIAVAPLLLATRERLGRRHGEEPPSATPARK